MTDFSTVAVLIPCLDEEATIQRVVADFQSALPGASIHVFDNGSTDRTAELARAAGAHVTRSPDRGKGSVVRHMFRDVDAEIYVIVDGDDTYPARMAPELISAARDHGADIVVGSRLTSFRDRSFRRFHFVGNQLVAVLISTLFGVRVIDVMSGYRVLSREFVKAVPLLSKGFEVETEMTLQALTKGFVIKEVPVEYGLRPEGSASKLNTISDGFLVLRAIVLIFKDYKPLVFFAGLSVLLAALSVAAGWLPVVDYLSSGFVPHFPRAILAAALGILSALSLGVGLILQTLLKYHLENYELWRKSLRTRGGAG